MSRGSRGSSCKGTGVGWPQVSRGWQVTARTRDKRRRRRRRGARPLGRGLHVVQQVPAICLPRLLLAFVLQVGSQRRLQALRRLAAAAALCVCQHQPGTACRQARHSSGLSGACGDQFARAGRAGGVGRANSLLPPQLGGAPCRDLRRSDILPPVP